MISTETRVTSADEVSSALLRSRPCRQRASSALVAPRDEATSSTHLRIVACAGPATPDTGVGARSSSPRPTLMDAPAGMPNPSFWSWHSKAAFARTQCLRFVAVNVRCASGQAPGGWHCCSKDAQQAGAQSSPTRGRGLKLKLTYSWGCAAQDGAVVSWPAVVVRHAYNMPRRRIPRLYHLDPYKALPPVLPEMPDILHVQQQIKATASFEELAVALSQNGKLMNSEQLAVCFRKLPAMARRQRTPLTEEQQVLPATVISLALTRCADLLPLTSPQQATAAVWAVAATWRRLADQLRHVDTQARQAAAQLHQCINQATEVEDEQTRLFRSRKDSAGTSTEQDQAPSSLSSLQGALSSARGVLSSLTSPGTHWALSYEPLPPRTLDPLMSEAERVEHCTRELQQAVTDAGAVARARLSHVQQLHYLQQAAARWPWSPLHQYVTQRHADMSPAQLATWAWSLAALRQGVMLAGGHPDPLLLPDMVLRYISARVGSGAAAQLQLGISSQAPQAGTAGAPAAAGGQASSDVSLRTGAEQLSGQLGWRGIAQVGSAATIAATPVSAELTSALTEAMSHRLRDQLQERRMSEGVLIPRCMYRYKSIKGWSEVARPRPSHRSKYLRTPMRPPKPLDFTPTTLIATLRALSTLHADQHLYLPPHLLDEVRQVLSLSIPTAKQLRGPQPIRGRDLPVYRPGEEPRPIDPAFQVRGMRLSPRTVQALITTLRSEERAGDVQGAVGRAAFAQLAGARGGRSRQLTQCLSQLRVAASAQVGSGDQGVQSVLRDVATQLGLDATSHEPQFTESISVAQLAQLLHLLARLRDSTPLAQGLALASVRRAHEVAHRPDSQRWLSMRPVARMLTAVWLLPPLSDPAAQDQFVRLRNELCSALQDWAEVHVPSQGGGREALLCAAALSVWPAHNPSILHRVAGRVVNVKGEDRPRKDELVSGWVAQLSPRVRVRLTQGITRAQKDVTNELLRYLNSPPALEA